MCFFCEACEFKSVEVKAGGGIPEKGKKLTLSIKKDTKVEDMRRDILKSETSSVHIPEWELNMEKGTMGGMYTTVEGLLTAFYENLERVSHNFLGKDRYVFTNSDDCASKYCYF